MDFLFDLFGDDAPLFLTSFVFVLVTVSAFVAMFLVRRASMPRRA